MSSNGYSKNSFRMGLPKPNRYQPNTGFRKVGSLNGRSWMKMDKANKLSLKNNSNYVAKPKVSEMKKQDALYRHQLFLQRLSSGKSVKVAGALTNKAAKKTSATMDTTIGFKTFSPWDSRFPESIFESFSPFDMRFAAFATEKIFKSFSPFDYRFPAMQKLQRKYRPMKGFQSFSPFDSRFPKNVDTYSPFDSRFPVGGTSKAYPTYSPFDAKFPKHSYSKAGLKKVGKTVMAKGVSSATLNLNRQMANKKMTNSTTVSLKSEPTTPNKGSMKNLKKDLARGEVTQKKSSKKDNSNKNSHLTAAKSNSSTPKASQTPVNFFTASKASAAQTAAKSAKTTSTSIAANPQVPVASAPARPMYSASYIAAPATRSFVQNGNTSSMRFPQAVAPVASAPMFLPTTVAAPLPDAFPRFTPMARANQQLPHFYSPQMASMGRTAPSPLSSVMQNGGGYTRMANNTRFGAM